MAQMVKNLPTVLETWNLFLGWEVPLEKGMATHSNILGWRISWRAQAGGGAGFGGAGPQVGDEA